MAAEDSEEHANFINSFKEVCAVGDKLAKDFLVYNHWNLEAAVQHFFHTGGQLEEEEEQNASNAANELRHRHVQVNEPSTSQIANQHPPLPLAKVPLRRRSPAPQTWFEWAVTLVKLPFFIAYQSLFELVSFLWSLFRAPPLAVADSRGDVRHFIDEFNARFGDSNNGIRFFTGSYDDAINECKNSLRFMIVYLHNPSHESCERFVRETLLSYQMKHFLDRNEILLWGVSVRSQEGYKVSMALRENTYPFLGLLCMRETRMVVVLRLEGEYELEPMLFTIQTAIDENRSYLDAIRNERHQREVNNRILREQESDYQRSLTADRARLNERKRAESERKMAEMKKAEEKKKKQEKKEKLDAIRVKLASELPPESQEPNCIRVSVRFPNGERFERRFDVTNSLELLFNATLAHENCPPNLTLLSSYPRKQLNCAPEWYREFGTVQDPTNIPTFQDCGFEKSVVVLVQDNDA
ncbi:UBX domain-containing protein [Loa loa]|uniref:UBX domain-containing protein n=1 Tax=Loa loa TaxID=7209 RepID=A0A1I7VND7_LOALO|nr:UBX domain-containing protein [Loa loa]EFO16453.2 UBX domain-containing protein [Loa loa]